METNKTEQMNTDIKFSESCYRYIICVYAGNEKSFYTGHDGYNSIISTINIWKAKTYFSKSAVMAGLREAMSINSCNHESSITKMVIAKVFMSALVEEEA